MDVSSTYFNIITFNCKSIKRSINDVRKACSLADIVCLQETWLLGHDLDFVYQIDSDFDCTAKTSVDLGESVLRGRPWGGLAIMWRKSKFRNVSVVESNSDRIAAVQITLGLRTFIVFSVYMPVDNKDNLAEFISCLGRMSAIVEESQVQVAYFVGDYNAHPNTDFGKELLSFCEEQKWNCIDMTRLGITSNTFTFVDQAFGSCRWLDHCVVTEAAIDTVQSVQVITDVLWSDHLPLLIKCNIESVCEKESLTYDNVNSSTRYIKWGQRNVNQINLYGKYCFDNLTKVNDVLSCANCNLDNTHTCTKSYEHFNFIDLLYDDIVGILQKAAILSSGSHSGVINKKTDRVIGWNFHIKELHQKARLDFYCWLLAGKPSRGIYYDQMRISRSKFKNKIKWCQKNEEMIKMNILAKHRQNKNFAKFWSATKSFNFKKALPVSVGGEHEPIKIAEMFAKRFKVNPENQDVFNAQARDAGDAEPFRVFTPKDIMQAVRDTKKGKSPGHDGLSIEHIQWASNLIYSKLTNFFNLCCRYSYLPDNLMKTIVVPIIKNKTGDLANSANYRPISLGTVMGKLFERLLRPSLVNNFEIDDAQFGFRAGLSTDSAIFSLKQTAQYYVNRDTSVYACFLDLSRAFDLVNYEILWNKLADSEVPKNVVSLLKFWYGHQTNVVRWGDSTSSEYRLDCGVRQGGLTSPDLFNIYMNDLIEELRSTRIGCHVGDVCVNNLSYADDMVLLSPSVSGLRKLLAICERYATKHGLIYNVAKTEMMVFRAGGGPERIPKVFLRGSPVKVVKHFKYLGHILTENLSDDADMERERRNLSIRCNMLARRFSSCSTDVKTTLFKAFCLCLYTCQLWTKYKRKTHHTIRVQYNDAFRILMKKARFCSASGMFADGRVPDFFAVIRSRIASFWSELRRSKNGILQCLGGYLGSPIYHSWLTVHQSANRK